MKKNLKVGDKVRINLSAEYSGNCNITEHMRGYDKREAEIVSINDSTTDGSNRYRLDVDNECFYYVAEWLERISESIVIPIDDWQRIYDVACDAWKKKLYEKVAPFAKAVTIDEEFAQSMLKASNAIQLVVVKDVLSSAGYGVENGDNYFDFNDEHMLTHRSASSPMYIRYGLASSEYMANKEIGFAIDFEVILVEDGVERTISSDSFLKFKKK